MKPGGSFTYDFVVPDAGLFWYHPHVMSAAQVGFGLYGALLVEDPAERRRSAIADELVLVLSDIGVDEHGVLESPDSGGSHRHGVRPRGQPRPGQRPGSDRG